MTKPLKLHPITRSFADQPDISERDIDSTVNSELARAFGDHALFDQRVVLGASSRGIPNYGSVFCAAAKWLVQKGANVLVIPAMGSHGGSDGPMHGEDQVALLASRHGITSERLGGVPIESSMETVCVGRTSLGTEVHLSKAALEHKGLFLPINRIHPHTHFASSNFTGVKKALGSGVRKMLVIGFGKANGARAVHCAMQSRWPSLEQRDTEVLGDVVEEVSRFIVDKGLVLGGIGIVDNARGGTAHICAFDAENCLDEEGPWLERALSYIPNLPIEALDVLIIHHIGKEISGTGAAPQISRRWPDTREEMSRIPVVGMLRLTEETHGSGYGIGFSDITTRELVGSIDFELTETNTSAAGEPELGIPPDIIVENERELFEKAVLMAGKTLETVRLMYIQDTKHLGRLYCSAAAKEVLVGEFEDMELGALSELLFDKHGNIESLSLWGENGDCLQLP